MKKKRALASALLSAALASTAAAQTITLPECRQMARDNYPAIRQYGMIDKTRDYTVDNAAKAWLPQVSITGGALAFTDVVKQNEQMRRAGMDMNNLMADAALTVRQNVYDGGQTAAQKRVARAEAETERRQLDVSMYAIGDRIDQLFFGILTIDEQLEQNRLLTADLTTSEHTVRSMMKGGIANQSDLDAVLVEKLKAAQQADALQASRKAYVRMLGTFIGRELGADARLQKPQAVAAGGQQSACSRPELNYYDSQYALLDTQRKLLDTRLRPTLALFGAAMAHTRRTNAVNNGVLAGGITLSWNIGALYTRRNDLRKIAVKRDMVNAQRDVFLFNNRLQNEDADGAINALKKQISQDNEIVKLRENIRQKSERKVQLGTESVNELVRNINAVSLARAQKALHEVQLLREEYRMKDLNNL